MIRLISGRDRLYRALGDKADIYTEKIRSFSDTYGFGYDFCRFWVQDEGSAVICGYYDDAAAIQTGSMDDDEAEELGEFLSGGFFRHILMPYSLCVRCGLAGAAGKVHLMRWKNDVKSSVETDKEPIKTDIGLGKVYEIAARGFDIDRDKWYTDTSYMLRHGTAGVYMLDDAACAVRMYSTRGITYLSYVTVLPERRGEGLAKRLLRGICAGEAAKGNETYVFCEDTLLGFYEKAGFEHAGYAADIMIQQ